jgi:hypothetical protein
MIRITKPEQAPSILRKRGQRTTEANQQAFINGERTFKFDSSIYGAKSVKMALIKAQHDKCAFCESKVGHIAFGDVEHYRPKGGVRQNDTGPLEQPGYFWLAYAWENLFFACQLCNQSFKKNLFPLADPARRAQPSGRHHCRRAIVNSSGGRRAERIHWLSRGDRVSD